VKSRRERGLEYVGSARRPTARASRASATADFVIARMSNLRQQQRRQQRRPETTATAAAPTPTVEQIPRAREGFN
jgi:hypothetical protein